jgi:preprotein translocase subunit SecD
MRTASVRLRLLIIAAVVGVSVWILFPPWETISLGLDLRGGLQLVLRVRTEEALRRQTRAAAEQLEEQFARTGAATAKVEVVSPSELVVSGIVERGLQASQDGHEVLPTTSVGLESQFDRFITGPATTFRLKPDVVRQIRRDTVQQAIETIERRVNQLGLSEPVVAPYTDEDQVLVQLPGVEDVEGAKRIIRATAQLRLTVVERGPFASRDAALQGYGSVLPDDVEILPGSTERGGETVFYVVASEPVVTGADLRNAQQSLDDFNRPAVAFTLRTDAGRRFGEFTARHVNRVMATVVDDRVVAVATIISRIDDRGQIVGLTREEMIEQVITLNSGALPATLDYLDQRTVSATLGQAAIRAGVLASLGGLALVTVFMLAYYKAMGLNAFVSIAVNLLVLLALMALVDAKLTLPGIAGFVLTIGMGVDSNVLIFERIREELATAAGRRSAIHAAFDRVWITIVDTHVASLLAAAVLFQFGTGPVRGFATTLALGLLANVFTAVFVSKTIFDLTSRRRKSAGQ